MKSKSLLNRVALRDPIIFNVIGGARSPHDLKGISKPGVDATLPLRPLAPADLRRSRGHPAPLKTVIHDGILKDMSSTFRAQRVHCHH
jgi:hypothetical protein